MSPIRSHSRRGPSPRSVYRGDISRRFPTKIKINIFFQKSTSSTEEEFLIVSSLGID
jgi:hypothetical protein